MKYHLFDAKGKILGRLATEAAVVLRGKNEVEFTPNKTGQNSVVIINSDKVRLSGAKAENKMYHRFSGYPSGISSENFSTRMKKDSTRVIKDAVYGMLPKNKLRKILMQRLNVYKDEKHPHKISKK